MEVFGVEQGFLLLQQGGLGGLLPLRQLGGQRLLAGVLLPAMLLGFGQFGGSGLDLLFQRENGFGQFFQLQALLVFAVFGIGEGEFALSLLPIGFLLHQRGHAGGDVLQLLGLAVGFDFGDAAAAVGFEHGLAGLAQGLLRLLAVLGLGAAFCFQFGQALFEGGGFFGQDFGGARQFFGFLRQLGLLLGNVFAPLLRLCGAGGKGAGLLLGGGQLGGEAALFGLGLAQFGFGFGLLLRQFFGFGSSYQKLRLPFGQCGGDFIVAGVVAYVPVAAVGVVQQHAEAVDAVALRGEPFLAGFKAAAVRQCVIQIGRTQNAFEPVG